MKKADFAPNAVRVAALSLALFSTDVIRLGAAEIFAQAAPAQPQQGLESLTIPKAKAGAPAGGVPEFRPNVSPGPTKMRQLYDMMGPQFMRFNWPYNGRMSGSDHEANTRLRPFTWSPGPDMDPAKIQALPAKMKRVEELTKRRRMVQNEMFRLKPPYSSFPGAPDQAKSAELLTKEKELDDMQRELVAIVREYEDPVLAASGPPQASKELLAIHPDFKGLSGDPMIRFLTLIGAAQEYVERNQGVEPPVNDIISAASRNGVELTFRQAKVLVETPLPKLATVARPAVAATPQGEAVKAKEPATANAVTSNPPGKLQETFAYPPAYDKNLTSYGRARELYRLTGQISLPAWRTDEMTGEWTDERVLKEYPIFRAADGRVEAEVVAKARNLLNELAPLQEKRMQEMREARPMPGDPEKAREAMMARMESMKAAREVEMPIHGELNKLVIPRLFPGVTPTKQSLRPSDELIAIDPALASLSPTEMVQLLSYLSRAQTFAERYPAKRESQLKTDSPTLNRLGLKPTMEQYERLLTTPMERFVKQP